MRRAASRRAAALTLLLAASWGASAANAGGGAPCEDPFVFPGAAINAVVLPFSYTGAEGNREVSETGQRLATLVQLEVLLSLVKYQSVGAVVLSEFRPGGCDKEFVLRYLDSAVRPGHGVILISGRLFEQEDQLYVQTYVRFWRQGAAESLSFSLPSAREPSYNFAAELPREPLAFTPRRLSRLDLQQIESEFRDATTVRESRDRNARGEALHQDPREAFAYSVREARDGWMFIEHRDGSQRGWIRARDDDDWSLRRKLPELSLVDAIAGYLRLRVGRLDSVAAAPKTTADNARRALETYLRYSGTHTGEMPEAMAWVLDGMVSLYDPDREADAIERAATAFKRAAQQAPADSTLRNLAALPGILMYNSRDNEPEDVRQAVRTMLAAVSLDPSNDQALANLEACYEYLRGHHAESPAYSAEELDRRWRQVQAVRSRGQ